MACRHGLRYCRLSLILAITALLTAAVVGQGNQYPYHSDPILLTSVEPLGSLEDGRGRFYGGLIAGDLNEDGPVDVFGHVAVSWIQPGPEQPFVVLLNDGAGGLVDGTSTILAPPRPTGFGTGPALVGDYNGDGQNDVWVSSVGLDQGGNPDAGSPNWLLLSGPDGLLHDVSGEKLPQFKSFTHGPSAADTDGDGDIDIWENNLGGPDLVVSLLLVNDGSGGFTIVADTGWDCLPAGIDGCSIVGQNDRLPDLMEGRGGLWSVFVDAEGDGDADLHLGLIPRVDRPPECPSGDLTCGEDRRVLLINDGTGRFVFADWEAIPPPPFKGEGLVQDMAIHDVNEDGLEDMVLHQTAEDGGSVIQILISNGDGTFRDETYLRLPYQPEDDGRRGTIFSFADLDGDGHDDLLSMYTWGTLLFFLNDGKGNFRRLPDDWAPLTYSSRVSHRPGWRRGCRFPGSRPERRGR